MVAPTAQALSVRPLEHHGEPVTVAELLGALEAFQGELEAHRQLWGDSLDPQIPDTPVANVDELRKQSRSLSRRLGAVRPYLIALRPNWMMGASGVSWDALDEAVRTEQTAAIKGPSLDAVIDVFDQIIGRLQGLPPEENVATDRVIARPTDTQPLRPPQVAPVADRRRVFVVHGRDMHIQAQLFAFLEALGLQPLDWSEAIKLTGQGSPYIGEVLDAAFGHAQAIVVLLTPDDEVRLTPTLHSADDGPSEREFRMQPRPNVLFEAGLGFGRSPDRTILVEVGLTKPFSDVAGRHIVRLANDETTRRDLAQRLATAGCEVRPDNDTWLRAGDFQMSRTLQTALGARVGVIPPGTVESAVKWVDIKYPHDSGIQAALEAEGFAVRWSWDSALARRLDIEGWSLVTQRSESGRDVVLKIKDQPEDQTLVKKKIGSKTAPA